MTIDKIPGLDQPVIFGLPYHGLWKNGSIALPNGTSKTAPAPAGGGVVLLRVPGQPAVSRTTEQAAADTASGMSWKNYGLISGGRYGDANLNIGINVAQILLIDSGLNRWLLRLEVDANYINYGVLRIRRFGVIDGTSAAWSAPINVTLPSELVSALSSGYFCCVGQNTNGRDFMVAAMALATYAAVSYSWTAALCRITVSGTVNLGAANYGLTFTPSMIESAYRNNSVYQSVSGNSGVCSTTDTIIYSEYPVGGGAPTGNTYTRIIVYTDGVIVSDNDAPTGGTGNWSISSTTSEGSSSKTRYGSFSWEIDHIIWAGYVEDNLQTAKMVISQTYDYSFGCPLISADLCSGSQQVTESTTIQIFYGSSVVYDETYVQGTFVASFSSGSRPGSGIVPSENPIFVNDRRSYLHMIQNQKTYSNAREAVCGVAPGPVGWTNPCIAVIRFDETAPIGINAIRAVAPSGVTTDMTIPLSILGVTWHPVTNMLHVDDVPICWF